MTDAAPLSLDEARRGRGDAAGARGVPRLPARARPVVHLGRLLHPRSHQDPRWPARSAGVLPAARLLRVLPAARVSLARDRLDDLGPEGDGLPPDATSRCTRWRACSSRCSGAVCTARRWRWSGGLLFAVHPASHEAVYWIAARFDLLATVLHARVAPLAAARRRGVVLDRRRLLRARTAVEGIGAVAAGDRRRG